LPRPLEPLQLERAQDLGLQPWRQVTNLVEEQRAAVRHLELAQLALRGAGEGALLVAEQLRLEQRLRMAAQLMATNGPSALGLSACTARAMSSLPVRSPFDEDGRVAAGRAAYRHQHLAERFVLADDVRHAAPHGQLSRAARSRWRGAAARAPAPPAAAGDRG